MRHQIGEVAVQLILVIIPHLHSIIVPLMGIWLIEQELTLIVKHMVVLFLCIRVLKICRFYLRAVFSKITWLKVIKALLVAP